MISGERARKRRPCPGYLLPAPPPQAGELQIGDRVTWLAGWNYGEPSKIIKVRELDPEYAGITEELVVVHFRYLLTRRLRRDRLVARVIAKTCDPGARIWSLNGKAGLLMHAYPDPAGSAACRGNMPARKRAPDWWQRGAG